jgi:uncharacterized protein (DUF486 family)
MLAVALLIEEVVFLLAWHAHITADTKAMHWAVLATCGIVNKLAFHALLPFQDESLAKATIFLTGLGTMPTAPALKVKTRAK